MQKLTRDDRGDFKLGTATGSRYEISLTDGGHTMRRISRTPDGELRRDREVIVILAFDPIQVGEVALFTLEALSPNGALATMRRTSAVNSIERCA